MSDFYYPDAVPPVYRGGGALTCKPHEVKRNRATGNIRTSHGVSVDAEPQRVVQFGGAFRVVRIPVELTIVQRGQRETHFEIVPKAEMTLDHFRELLSKVELAPWQES